MAHELGAHDGRDHQAGYHGGGDPARLQPHRGEGKTGAAGAHLSSDGGPGSGVLAHESAQLRVAKADRREHVHRVQPGTSCSLSYLYIYFTSFFSLVLPFFSSCSQAVLPSYARSETKNARSEIDKSAVFDRAKSFSFRKRKVSYVRPKIRLGLNCGASGMPGGWGSIIGNLNLRGLTQVRLELFRVQLSSCTIVLVGCLLKVSALLAAV